MRHVVRIPPPTVRPGRVARAAAQRAAGAMSILRGLTDAVS